MQVLNFPAISLQNNADDLREINSDPALGAFGNSLPGWRARERLHLFSQPTPPWPRVDTLLLAANEPKSVQPVSEYIYSATFHN